MTDWKTVPTEPTDGMIEVGSEAMACGAEWGRMISCVEVYEAMLAASPPAPAGEPVAWVLRWQYKPPTDRDVKYPGGGEMIRANRGEIDAQIAVLKNFDRVDWFEETPLYTHPLDAAAIRAEARREALEEAARLIEAQNIVHTSDGDELAPRMDGNRSGLAYAFAIRALVDKGEAEGWRPIETAPKDTPILAWCDHEADPYSDTNDASRLTLYAAHAEGLSHAPTGFHIVEWGGGWSDGADDGGAWMPDWWFVAGSEFEVAANPVRWWPLPASGQKEGAREHVVR